MRPFSSIVKKMNYRKRKINSISENFSPLSTAYKSSININYQNSLKNSKKQQNKSQFKLKKKLTFIDSNNLNYSNHPNVLTSKYKINLGHKCTPEIVGNKTIYTSIISKLEKIMNQYKEDIKKLHYILSNIENFINKILQEDFLTIKNNKIARSFKKSLTDNLDNKYENKKNIIISSINNKKINISSNNILENLQQESEICIYKKKVNKLLLKINEIENKFKIEKLKYLFCIGEYQKRLNDIEQKLNLDSIDKMPKDELKKFLCYPHYVKFDINEDINPKSIPMSYLRNMQRKKCQSSTYDNRINKNSLSKSDNEFNCYDYDLKNNINLNSFDLLDNTKNINNNDKIIINDIEEEKMSNIEKDINIGQVKSVELGKIKFDSKIQVLDKIFGNDKNFLLSHPKLNYIKSLNEGNKMLNWKLDNQINSLPQQLSKLKTLSKSKKNALIVFPSFLNETLVNLEKLRTNKNFKNIENKFEEILKIKLKD